MNEKTDSNEANSHEVLIDESQLVERFAKSLSICTCLIYAKLACQTYTLELSIKELLRNKASSVLNAEQH